MRIALEICSLTMFVLFIIILIFISSSSEISHHRVIDFVSVGTDINEIKSTILFYIGGYFFSAYEMICVYISHPLILYIFTYISFSFPTTLVEESNS